MIDTHCHIIPRVDDGSDSIQTSLMMAAMAADDGVKAIICTPHILWNRDYKRDIMRSKQASFEELRKAIAGAGIPITCFVGAEVLLEEAAEKLLREGHFPRLFNTNYALVEFYFDDSFDKMSRKLEAVARYGIKPIIAHPERYFAIQKRKELLREWKADGYYLQVDKQSLLGEFGRKEKKIADWMIANRIADLLGSDAHGVRNRTVTLHKTKRYIEKNCGEEYAKLLTRTNPYHLLKNEPLRRMG